MYPTISLSEEQTRGLPPQSPAASESGERWVNHHRRDKIGRETASQGSAPPQASDVELPHTEHFGEITGAVSRTC